MTEHAQVIVLGTTKSGESSLVVHTLSDLWGRRSFLVTMSHKTAAGLFRPMSVLDCEVTPNRKSDLWRAGKFSRKHLLSGIRASLPKTAITMFMSEVLFRTIREGGRDERLFDWCERTAVTLDAIESDFSNYPVIFLLELADILGFRPTELDLAPFVGEQFSLVRLFLGSPAAEALLVPMNGASRSAMCEGLLRYLERHTEARIDIRSMAVLHDLFTK